MHKHFSRQLFAAARKVDKHGKYFYFYPEKLYHARG